MLAHKPQTGIGLIDRAIGLDPGIELGHFLAIGQTRQSAIAGARIDAVERYHPWKWLLAHIPAQSTKTAMNCIKTRRRISLLEWDRPKSPPRKRA